MDEVLAYTVGSARYFVHNNHLFSPAAVTDGTGTVVERYRYDAYGTRTVTNAAGTVEFATSSVSQSRGFTGYIYDSETGWYHARMRPYSPTLGRFPSRDPLGYIDGYNSYAAYFVPGFTDPSGQAKMGQPCPRQGMLEESEVKRYSNYALLSFKGPAAITKNEQGAINIALGGLLNAGRAARVFAPFTRERLEKWYVFYTREAQYTMMRCCCTDSGSLKWMPAWLQTDYERTNLFDLGDTADPFGGIAMPDEVGDMPDPSRLDGVPGKESPTWDWGVYKTVKGPEIRCKDWSAK